MHSKQFAQYKTQNYKNENDYKNSSKNAIHFCNRFQFYSIVKNQILFFVTITFPVLTILDSGMYPRIGERG